MLAVPVSDTVAKPSQKLRGIEKSASEESVAKLLGLPWGSMGRALRHEEKNGVYHATSRGNDGRDIFIDAQDRIAFLVRLSRITEERGWLVYAYCLLTNHYHLVLRIPRGELSAGMKALNGGHSQRTNRRHGRTGHLFRNRFFASPVETPEHLLEALRYVALNPVRAGLCAQPGEWPWSSYRASAGLDARPEFLALDELLRFFAPAPVRAMAEYRSFVSAGVVSPRQVPVSDTVTRT